MRIIGDIHFVVEDDRLFLTCDSEKESDDWSFFVLSRVPVASELKTNISISNYKNIKKAMRLEIEFGLELEKIKDVDSKIDDSFSIFLFIDDEFGDELLWSLVATGINTKKTNLIPIQEGSELELVGTYYKLKVKILNVKTLLKF